MNNAKRSENVKTQLYKLESYCDYTGEIIGVRIIDLVDNVNAFAKVIVDTSVDINLVDGRIFIIPSQESFYNPAEKIFLEGCFIEGDENILNILDISNKIYQGKIKKSKKTNNQLTANVEAFFLSLKDKDMEKCYGEYIF